MVSFDPYLNWLGIPPHEQPPTFYRLLGVVLFESNAEVIEQAADRQSLRVGSYQSGPQGEMCQQLLSEIAMARFCLLDPQQKALYDGQLYAGLAQRGERSVAAPPPPASMADARQSSSQLPQFGLPLPQISPQAGMGAINPGNAAQGPMILPGPPLPMQAPMPGVAAMSGPARMSMPQLPPSAMQVPPTMMSAPPSFMPAMPQRPAPVSMPVASPFPPTAMAVVAARIPTPAAPPTFPPAAPQRPIDELESLTSRPASRRHIRKKKKKTDYTKEVIIGSVVTATTVLLLIVYAANHSPSGYDAIKPEKPMESIRKKLDEQLLQIAKDREKEKERKAAAERASANSGKNNSLRPLGDVDRHSTKGSQAANDGDVPLPKVRDFGPPSRAMDSPEPGGPVRAAPQPAGRDTPQDLGGPNDPVFETPKPNP